MENYSDIHVSLGNDDRNKKYLIFVHVNLTLKFAFLPFVSVDLIQMLEFNLTVSLPAASLLTVVLALVGKFHISFKYPYYCSILYSYFCHVCKDIPWKMIYLSL